MAKRLMSMGSLGTLTANGINAGGGADIIVYDTTLEGSAAGSEEGTYSAFDVITGFTTTSDHIDYNTTLTGTGVIAGSVGDADLTSSNYTDADAVLAFVNDASIEDLVDATGGDYEAGQDFLLAVTISGVGTAVYEIINDATAAIVTTEVSLLATVDATMVAGDFM